MALRSRSTLFATALAVIGAASAAAQDHVVTLAAYGGGYSALKQLNTAGTAEFAPGFTLGGGIGYKIDKSVELRATLTGAQSQLRQGATPTGVYLNRYYLAVDVKAEHPTASGIAPYGFFGAGAVLLHEKASTGADKTQGFAHLGVGIAYTIKSGLSIFAQGDGLFYSLTEMTSPTFTSFSAAQIDVGWSAGVSYRLGS
ncbi:MAG: hypothetical protein AUH12_08855 [Gemmatimonadetes bacterium 13_2_20CM_69_8]|nr:MAG: hypothetical protein AUH12_08855 [Gemmatimonadetes bacterium 13_2_20CM_69_8]OLD93362.1 MAG: hypothetical protein AUG79_11790 [Gemmatimonadetes bacterium 13_1_20CM_4_69_16]PYO15925.1 MAG: hypothetical protein DMD31_03145 [Gemmatimonadota bacterium]